MTRAHLVVTLLAYAIVVAALWFSERGDVADAEGELRRFHSRVESRPAERRARVREVVVGARIAGTERGLQEGNTLIGVSSDERAALAEARREALEAEARSAGAEVADLILAEREAALDGAVTEFARQQVAGAEAASDVRAMVVLIAGCLVILVSMSLAQRTGRAKLDDARRQLDDVRGELASTRGALEKTVDEKTAALGVALDESRELNERLKEVLAELETAQALLVRQEKMAALGTLAGGVAHEFNNILGGIRGCAEDLLSEAPDEDAKETLEVVVRAARRGRTIVDGLMTFSRGATRESERVELAETVGEVVRLLRPEAAELGVEIGVKSSQAAVSGDPVALHQVVLNLVKNAVQASKPGDRVEVTLEAHEDRARLRVLDRGSGIAAENAERIFEPFFTTRELAGGSGLGLAISHGIVQGLSGTLTFESRDGGGTVFVVDLPLEA